MKKYFIIALILLSLQSSAVVVWDKPLMIIHTYGCDNLEYIDVGFQTLSEFNNSQFQIMRSTDPGFSSAIYIGAPIASCGTCTGTSYYVSDYGPFIDGVVYYYQVKATSSIGVDSYFNLNFHIGNVPTVVNWINQVTSSVEISSTPNSENSYNWDVVSHSLQGATISLSPTEVAKVYLEQGNHILNFELDLSLSMISIDINIDNLGYTNLYSGAPITNHQWASSITGIGLHSLFVNFTDAVSGTIYHREYKVYVVPKSDQLFRDNYCNTMRVWKNQSGSNGIPLLLSEGFDAYNTKPEQYYREAGKDLINCLLSKGFDIYIINYKYNSQDIRNNAAAFSSAIRYISSINNNQPIVAAGISMGGIINRYACAKAEGSGTPLPVSKFVTLDAPHQGAIISHALQDWRKSVTAGDAFAENAGRNPAAEELLTYDAYTTDGGVFHNTFVNELNSLNGNGYPHLIPTIGVSFSTTTSNPNTGEWLYIHVGGVPGDHNQNFYLTPEELSAGSFLPSLNIDPVPVVSTNYWSSSLISLLRPFADGSATAIQYSNPTFIPHNSSLDIVGGVSKFNIIIQTGATGYHDVIPTDIIEPLINALITKDLYLQNKAITDTKNYIAGNKIQAGNNVTTTIPIGNFILANGSNVTMKAGNNIVLSDGFTAQTGSNFDALIGLVHCDGVQATQLRNVIVNTVNTTENANVFTSDQVNILSDKSEIKTISKTNNFRIYPNPTNDYFTLESDILPKSLIIYDDMGIKLFENIKIESSMTKIDLSSQPKGIYFIKITNFDNTISTKKIIKQ